MSAQNPIPYRNSGSSFETFEALSKHLYDELSAKLCDGHKNNARKQFMPYRAPYDFFSNRREQLLQLYDCAHAAGLGAGQAGLERTRLRSIAFVNGIVGPEDQSLPVQDCRSRILAILLHIWSTTGSKSSHGDAWRYLETACTEKRTSTTVNDNGQLSSFRDRDLAFSRDQLVSSLGEQAGLDFYARQEEYSVPVLNELQEMDLATKANDTLLPYLRQDLLGTGSTGMVYRVRVHKDHIRRVDNNREGRRMSPETHREYARKDVQISRGEGLSGIQEWAIFETLFRNKSNYPDFIMPTLACMIFSDSISLFMDVADGGSLAQHMSESDKPAWPQSHEYLQSITNIAGGLDYLHTKIIDDKNNQIACYHLDLKPENILVVTTARSKVPVFKLADFSISSVKSKPAHTIAPSEIYNKHGAQSQTNGTRARTQLVTRSRIGIAATCIAPEAFEHRQVDERCDAWGFGCVLSIFLAWICEGKGGPEEFLQQRLKQNANKDDRFLSSNDDTKSQVNAAFYNWLRNVCSARDRIEQEYTYLRIWQLVADHLLLVQPLERSSLAEVFRLLQDIIKSAEASVASPVKQPDVFHQASAMLSESEIRGTKLKPKLADWMQKVVDKLPSSMKYVHREFPEPDVLERAGVSSLQEQANNHQRRNKEPLRRHAHASDKYGSVLWKSLALQHVRTFVTDACDRRLAMLHEESVTICELTGQVDRSQSWLISYQQQPLRCCAISQHHLSLLPESTGFKLCYYDIPALFTEPTSYVLESEVAQAISVALHPTQPGKFACLFIDGTEMLLCMLDTARDTSSRASSSSPIRLLWHSAFAGKISDTGSSQDYLSLTFSPNGEQVVLVNGTDASSALQLFAWQSIHALGEQRAVSYMITPTHTQSRPAARPGLAFLAGGRLILVHYAEIHVFSPADGWHKRLNGLQDCIVLQSVPHFQSDSVYLLAIRSDTLCIINMTLSVRQDDYIIKEGHSTALKTATPADIEKAPFHLALINSPNDAGDCAIFIKYTGESELVNLKIGA